MKKFLPVLLTLFYSSTLLLSSFASPIPASALFSNNFCAPRNVLVDVLTLFGLEDLITSLIDGPWYDPTTCQFQDKITSAPTDEIFGERYTYAQVNWITNSLYLQLFRAANNPIDALRRFLLGEKPTFKDFAGLGPSGVLMGSLTEMYTHPPASGIQYLASRLQKLDPATPVYAQGFGYDSLDGVQLVWTASRNMTYFIITILLIASGFLIMFRVKINPQTAVTLQLMIPKIIITLLLVTFSYAIAGLAIDMVYVLLSFIISVLSSSAPSIIPTASTTISWFTTPDFSKVFFYYINVWNTIGWAVIIPLLGQILGLVISLVVLWLIFKVWWMLLKTYIQLIFHIIIGPWLIMLDLLPGQSGFSSWFRNLVAHLSVFLVVPLMFLFNMILWRNNNAVSNFIIQLLTTIGDPGVQGIPGSATFPSFPLFGQKSFLFNFALGYAILALIPKIAEIVRDALKVPAFKYGTAFGEALGPIKTLGGYAEQYGAGVIRKRKETARAADLVPAKWEQALEAIAIARGKLKPS